MHCYSTVIICSGIGDIIRTLQDVEWYKELEEEEGKKKKLYFPLPFVLGLHIYKIYIEIKRGEGESA